MSYIKQLLQKCKWCITDNGTMICTSECQRTWSIFRGKTGNITLPLGHITGLYHEAVQKTQEYDKFRPGGTIRTRDFIVKDESQTEKSLKN